MSGLTKMRVFTLSMDEAQRLEEELKHTVYADETPVMTAVTEAITEAWDYADAECPVAIEVEPGSVMDITFTVLFTFFEIKHTATT